MTIKPAEFLLSFITLEEELEIHTTYKLDMTIDLNWRDLKMVYLTT
jgi:hypothetical protein